MPSPILGSLAVNDCKKRCKYSLSNPRAKMPSPKPLQVAQCHRAGSHLCYHRGRDGQPLATVSPVGTAAAPAPPQRWWSDPPILIKTVPWGMSLLLTPPGPSVPGQVTLEQLRFLPALAARALMGFFLRFLSPYWDLLWRLL